MIVLSLILVIVAAVTLIAGIFQSDSLLLIYVSIGACVGAMVLLGIGVLARRRTTTPATEGGYGPGASSVPVRPAASAPTRPTASATAAADRVSPERSEQADAIDDTVIVKKAAPPDGARKVTKKAVAKKTVVRSTAKQEEAAAEQPAEPAKAPARKSSQKTAAKKSPARKSSTKAAAKKSSAKKSSAKRSSKKGTKKSAAKKTTGADARAVLAAVPGVGPAKQDALLKAFGSLEDIKAASEDEVTAVPGIGPAAAKKIQKHLK